MVLLRFEKSAKIDESVGACWVSHTHLGVMDMAIVQVPILVMYLITDSLF